MVASEADKYTYRLHHRWQLWRRKSADLLATSRRLRRCRRWRPRNTECFMEVDLRGGQHATECRPPFMLWMAAQGLRCIDWARRQGPQRANMQAISHMGASDAKKCRQFLGWPPWRPRMTHCPTQACKNADRLFHGCWLWRAMNSDCFTDGVLGSR